jgi:hypothetical protein
MFILQNHYKTYVLACTTNKFISSIWNGSFSNNISIYTMNYQQLNHSLILIRNWRFVPLKVSHYYLRSVKIWYHLILHNAESNTWVPSRSSPSQSPLCSGEDFAMQHKKIIFRFCKWDSLFIMIFNLMEVFIYFCIIKMLKFITNC